MSIHYVCLYQATRSRTHKKTPICVIEKKLTSAKINFFISGLRDHNRRLWWKVSWDFVFQFQLSAISAANKKVFPSLNFFVCVTFFSQNEFLEKWWRKLFVCGSKVTYLVLFFCQKVENWFVLMHVEFELLNALQMTI